MKLLVSRNFLFGLAVVLGMLAPGWAASSQKLALPALAMVMTLSCLGVSLPGRGSWQSLAQPAITGIVMCYGVLSGVLLLLSLFFAWDPPLQDGFLLVALMPPAVAVIPFTDILGGDRGYSLMASAAAYLAALVIMPLLAVWFWGADFISLERLMVLILTLIVAPVVVAQALRRLGWHSRLEPVKGPLTNLGFFVVMYSSLGLNRDFVWQNPLAVLPVAVAAAVCTFGLGFLIGLVARRLGAAPGKAVALVLLGTLKNYGLATGLALAFFSQKSTLPSVVGAIFLLMYIIWLEAAMHWLPGLKEGRHE